MIANKDDIKGAAHNLRTARYRLGMNQSEFARFLEVHKTTYSLCEAGKRHFSFPTIRKIVDKLKENGIDFEYSDLRDDL